MPAVLVMVNDIAAFMEAYPKQEDAIVRFVREAGRNGIYLIMTADGTSSVRVRMRQSFRQVFAVNLADSSDYSMIFGSMHGVVEPNGFGRGLVKTEEGILEFQAAHLSQNDDDYGYAAALATDLAHRAEAQGLKRARSVPTVPERVTLEVLAARQIPAGMLPVGIYEDTLGVAGFDFEETAIARAVFQRRRNGISFMRAFVSATAASRSPCAKGARWPWRSTPSSPTMLACMPISSKAWPARDVRPRGSLLQ